MVEPALQIGEVSMRADVSVDTVRYYEKRKLIHSVSRTSGGFRLFKSHTVEQIRFIKQAQELGFSLDEIRDLLGSGSAEECQKVRDLLGQKISEVNEQIRKMKAFKKTLSHHLTACDNELEQNGQNANCPAFFEIKRGNK
ncbi:MAG: heavy metal-responsive transcriptional regulator [Pyrinomonadaceae bacterium]|nr:heavy metal-responsive transcriptional regulator [Pyrinomonadaceae bacterium]